MSARSCLIVWLALFAVYITTYYATARPMQANGGFRLPAEFPPQYFQAAPAQAVAEWIFFPIHQFDRQMRWQRWHWRIPVNSPVPSDRPPEISN
jgi:hypothetical protein